MNLSVDFNNIDYLQEGNKRQRQAYEVLQQLRLFNSLEEYGPRLVGTIPIGVDIPTSDLDIICHCKQHHAFEQHLICLFSEQLGFSISKGYERGLRYTLACFRVEPFDIEVFAQALPTAAQNAYRHMLVEHRLLLKYGYEFRRAVIALKKQGVKTEPAFAQLLGLEGDPYEALLALEDDILPCEVKPLAVDSKRIT